ncbi:GRIP and coiled-coil domain-containing protein 1 [Cololabis saira]|uniref:GRIP and coiled-coil domain-containing protein 1 n=1 Tax=Cololabis saira TaxID=129043 RepID=UPI002AD2EB0A|nr:GRIP and coiled-coil domain-containing protein 1 [Cololabis saira]
MDKFGMSFGGGPGRKELLETIESQKKQLVQYQTRFKDVVRAYKSLLKEKEALEASLKVLSVSQDLDLTRQDQDRARGPQDPLEDGSSLHSEDSLDTAASVDVLSETRGESGQEDQTEPGRRSSSTPDAESSGGEAEHQATPPAEVEHQATPPAESERRLSQLRAQLSTLTAAIATVTQEKSRMEANFQADKRQLKQEVEELQRRLVAAATQQEAEQRGLGQQLAESRARVITQQHEREQEQGDHAQQLRELQRLLQQERRLRQDAELRLQDGAAALQLAQQAAGRGAEAEVGLAQARGEGEELRRRLQQAEEERRRPDPRVEELQEEVTEVKKLFQLQMQAEARKVSEAEQRAGERAAAAEARVAGLEQRVSEMSDLLGSAEAARQRDQQAARRLRDRVLQLDTENKTLALAASGRALDPGPDLDPGLDAAALKDKLQAVKKLLALAAQRNPDQNLQDLLEAESGPGSGQDRAAAAAAQQELKQVRDEFERYKQRAQVVLKNKTSKDGCQTRELQEARDQLTEVREKYITLRIQSDEAEARQRQLRDAEVQQAAALQQNHKQDLERAEALHREQLLRLEAELHKQRQRTTALLDEKDGELERLRLAAPPNRRPDGGSEDGEAEGDAVGLALRRAAPTDATLLLYAEQLARQEVDAAALRRHKHRLEEELHRLQARLAADGERHGEEAAELRGRLDALAREQGREGANVEYLKNVIYRFLTLQDASGRQQTLGAILTILHFSPQERRDVLKLQGPAWWGPGRR